VASWVVYDLANTIFHLGVVGLYFPDWMTSNAHPDSWLSWTAALAGAFVIPLAPWVGARSDHTGRRVPILAATTLATVAATALLGLGPVWLTFAVMGIAMVAVNVGSVTYDALLPTVSTEQNRGLVSGLGVGVGYLGSFVGLGIGLVTLGGLGWSYSATFRTLAVAFLAFALPAFFLIREPAAIRSGQPPRLGSVLGGLVTSWRRAREHPDVTRFLGARFLYTDAINTLLGGFLTFYLQTELGFELAESTTLLGIAIAGAMVGGLAGGVLVHRFGPNRVLRIVLLMWVGAIATGVGAALTDLTALAWAIGPLGGFALGATWAADRVVMTRISPPGRLGEFYGLYATVGRFATIVGPLVWALVVDILGWGRTTALGALGVFVIAGWWVLGSVDDRVRLGQTRPT
jgi:UMF1 family MFS transporter